MPSIGYLDLAATGTDPILAGEGSTRPVTPIVASGTRPTVGRRLSERPSPTGTGTGEPLTSVVRSLVVTSGVRGDPLQVTLKRSTGITVDAMRMSIGYQLLTEEDLTPVPLIGLLVIRLPSLPLLGSVGLEPSAVSSVSASTDLSSLDS